MNIKIANCEAVQDTTIQITGSKSETNRLLILQALYPQITIDNISNSDDSQVLQQALNSEEMLVDIHHAGTAMRFLTAYFATREGREVTLTGSKRMQERPIKILVEALRQLGCDIQYEKNEGYPPLKISGKKITTQEVTLQANVSSQYISALMLIAPSLPQGLIINLEGKVTSIPYINMTLSLLRAIGVEGVFNENTIMIKPKETVEKKTIVVESDWSSASYFYSTVALSKETKITLGSYKKDSYQGDSALVQIYKYLGVETTFGTDRITLQKIATDNLELPKELDLSNSPDIAQTIAVTCFGLGIGCYLTGLHTLKIKETDRLEALKTELEKLGASVMITENSLTLKPSEKIKSDVAIATYQDHRMAMAFAPLGLKTSLNIVEAEVVSKSYPDFWTDLETVGFKLFTEK
ncbi:3-phosphoshikimate 1-carboxyvinyltransferase [Aquimarina rhabdastrellae]